MKIKKYYNNILVFNPAFLGDTVITTPLLKALKALFPNAQISFCVRPEHAKLFYNLPFIDNVILFDKRNTQKGFSGILKFANELSNFKFDLIINLHLSLRSTTLLSLIKDTYLIGYSTAVLSYLFNKRIEKKQELCEVERNLMFLSDLCDDFTLDEAKKLGAGLETYVDKTIYNNTTSYFLSTSPNKKVVGIAPGSVWATKRYPTSSYIKVAEMLYENGYAIALFGGKDDIESLDEFASSFKYPYYDFACKTSLSELPAIIKSVDLLLVNDSGLMHIACSVQTPCVAVFGPTTKQLGFFPYDEKSIVVENNNISCRPCGKHGGDKCPKKHFQCMLDIEPIQIFNAALSILHKD